MGLIANRSSNKTSEMPLKRINNELPVSYPTEKLALNLQNSLNLEDA